MFLIKTFLTLLTFSFFIGCTVDTSVVDVSSSDTSEESSSSVTESGSSDVTEGSSDDVSSDASSTEGSSDENGSSDSSDGTDESTDSSDLSSDTDDSSEEGSTGDSSSMESSSSATEINQIVISRSEYKDRLYGFWLGQCIANWTGLVTEMDKIGGNGEGGLGGLPFYTREDWGKPDHSSIWGQGVPSNLSDNIDFVFEDAGGVWGSDDDTDIEYIYQYLLNENETSILTGEQIKDGWLEHIRSEEENYLWVSNETAFNLMKDEAAVPPETSDPTKNGDWDMIDAQLTTEIFGFFAPGRPDVALKMAHLPIQTTARKNAEWASEFYVLMYSLASYVDSDLSMKDKVQWMAEVARQRLPEDSYSAAMYDYVKSEYEKGSEWEEARDGLYQKYQVNQEDGYDISSRGAYCNGCFASGINFGASIVSLLYGEGDIVETIKIGALAGWDSDNPTATWGGLLGFMLGKEGIETAFNRTFADEFNIHRTRKGFPNNGIDTFDNMAETGLSVVDRAVVEEMGGEIDEGNDAWIIPDLGTDIDPGT